MLEIDQLHTVFQASRVSLTMRWVCHELPTMLTSILVRHLVFHNRLPELTEGGTQKMMNIDKHEK